MSNLPEIKIRKAYAYLLGLAITFLMYFIGQGIFFINTAKAKGTICDAQYERIGRYQKERIFYVCFITKNWEHIETKAGSNLHYYPNDPVDLFYKVNNPTHIRLTDFTSLWAIPALPYAIPFVIIMALISGFYYKTKYIVISRRPLKVRFSNH
jgi:hypothetical protein